MIKNAVFRSEINSIFVRRAESYFFSELSSADCNWINFSGNIERRVHVSYHVLEAFVCSVSYVRLFFHAGAYKLP